ncbi:DNA mismatch repair endonuclease MutL [Desulfoglaeba alkanexedens]|uniref:DNA mismatch repair protein MutL n=1 Tax=Desulfoglaeba alkanexedens ALDC TaxID=980445 RepID=A0A4V1ERX3_9BACT|nr:DNA mismatch repair endonuclease MutL [Desulfoglaeba alkanexedens]QCQ23141.1 DNA mismatch repair endonuclease MutL [Desulfoglaeba alkanexedens ALDC]
MGRITLLPETLCNQIAAGEVVERPAAVVKELLENSIDAGSRRITVSLLQGGRKEIRVVDDGEGMDADDALLALERHATSKIRTAEDLQTIRSLGFRGEALPSIAAVSRFELVTKTAETVAGTRIEMEGGVLRDVRETGCPPGTSVTVRDLFFNLPARRKFLRSVDTEMAHITDQVLRLALAHPGVHFVMSHGGRETHRFPPVKDLRERVGQVLGTATAASLAPFQLETPSFKASGVLSPPEAHRNSTRSLFVTVNGRPVKDRLLTHAVLSAYDSLIPRGKYPLVVLSLTLPSEEVDVNVHPTKREVRFRRPSEVTQGVKEALSRSLLRLQKKAWSRPLAGGPFPDPTVPAGARSGLHESQEALSAVPALATPQPSPPEPLRPVPPSISPGDGPLHQQHFFDPSESGATETGSTRFSRLKILGQLADAYILLEAPDGLVLIDQHAAHERIVYERLVDLETGRPPSQRLLQPEVVEFLPVEAARLRRHLPQLEAMGFEVEPFGGDAFVIQAIPAALSRVAPAALLRSVVETETEERGLEKPDPAAALSKTAACHGAVRAGQPLTPEEIRKLLQDLDRTRVSATCPHGRPLWWKLTLKEIARLFART